MAFVLSRQVWMLTRPSHLLLLAFLTGALLQLIGEEVGQALIWAAALLSLSIAILPVSYWIARPLEMRFAAPLPMPAHVDGVIALGGALYFSGGKICLNGAGDRFVNMMLVARRYPAAKVVYAGGSALLGVEEEREADLARQLLQGLGFNTKRFLFERESRNTRENATLGWQLARPMPGETWLLVTSALHMPRAVGSFRNVGWQVTPYPVGFSPSSVRPVQWQFDCSGSLTLLDAAVKEWLGLAVYRWLGYTDALLPAPVNQSDRIARRATAALDSQNS